MENRNYIHKKTGQSYVVRGLVHIKLNGKWVDGISYKEYNQNNFTLGTVEYIRPKEDFLKKFELVKQVSEGQ